MPAAGTSSGFLAKPSNIYAESNSEFKVRNPVEAQPSNPSVSEQPELEMKLVMKDETPEAADEVKQPQPFVNPVCRGSCHAGRCRRSKTSRSRKDTKVAQLIL